MNDMHHSEKSNQSSRIFVGGLGDQLGKEDLEREFSKFGTLKNVWVAQNPPGFAFIEYEDNQDADEAVKEMNGVSISGARLRVEMSRERRGRGRGRRGGGGFRGGFRGGDRRGGPRGGSSGGRGFGGGRGGRSSGGFRGGRGSYDRPHFSSYDSNSSGGGGSWGRRGGRGSRDYSSERSGGYDSMGSYEYNGDVSSYRSRSPTGISSHSTYADQQY